MMWDALTVTYSSDKDKLQTFDLHAKANGLKQNGAPTPYQQPKSPTYLRKETAHQNILGGTQQGVTSRVKLTDDLDGIGLVSKGCRSDQKFNSSSSRIDKTKLKCENCEQHPSNNETEQHSSQVDQIEEEPVRYELPPRTNRGVPPKRYTLQKEARRSRYPIANIAKGNLSQESQIFTTSLYFKEILTFVEQALNSKVWREAMKTEMDALSKNDTMERCILPHEKKTVGCRWIFTIKYKPSGTIERYKARLVAKGYTQTYGIDYSETFSPVAKIDTIREEVYMDPPSGFVESLNPREVCHLKKSLYGLKQSPRAWFGRFTLAMRKYGFKQSNSDHTLFLKRKGKLITCLIIYVDDMIITGNDEEEMTRLRTNLFKKFKMKDLGILKYFLGIEVLRSKQGIFICQKKYVLDLLAETRMIDCKPVDTPMMLVDERTAEDDIEVFTTEPGLDRISAHNFLT
nr:putative reverse transcriptase, RNA-dependent DNA polymerase [Tanacetum cinerariifolium]